MSKRSKNAAKIAALRGGLIPARRLHVPHNNDKIDRLMTGGEHLDPSKIRGRQQYDEIKEPLRLSPQEHKGGQYLTHWSYGPKRGQRNGGCRELVSWKSKRMTATGDRVQWGEQGQMPPSKINEGDILWIVTSNDNRLFLFASARGDGSRKGAFRFVTIMYNKGHSRFEGVEIKGDLKTEIEMLGLEGPIRIGIELSNKLEALSEELIPSAPNQEFGADSIIHRANGMHLENKWIPKLVDYSNVDNQKSTGNTAAVEVIRESAGMAEDLDLLDSFGAENKRVLVSHLLRERSSGLRNKKIRAMMKKESCLKCEACNFDFELAYGSLGKGFAEVHHIKPLSTLGETETKLSDLAVLCSNCHRMIHRTNPIEDLKTFRARIQAVHVEEV